MASDLFAMLRKDHTSVKSVLKGLEETTERSEKRREEGFGKLKQELIPHMRGEEMWFFPPLKDHKDTKDLALEALEEHHAAETMLNELDGVSVTDETWGAKLAVLKEMIEHHHEEEEGEVFEAAEEVLDDAQLDEIMRQIQATKADLKASAR